MAILTRMGALQAISACEGLFQAHFEEIGKFRDLFAVKVDLKQYEKLDDAGRFVGIVAREADEVIGYAATFLVHNLHYVDTLLAQNDVIYVKPEHRLSRVGAQLMIATEDAARSLGAKLMVWHSKPDTALDALLARRHYEVSDIQRSKRL